MTDRRLAFGVLEFRSIWVLLEMAVGLTSHLFQRVPATDIFCQRNKLRVHIAPCFLAIHSLLCFHFTNFSLSLFYTEPWDEEFSSLVIHFVSFSCWCTFFFSIAKLAAQFNHSKTNLEGEDWLVILLLSCSSGRHLTVRVPFSPFSFVFEIWKITPLLCILNILCVI